MAAKKVAPPKPKPGAKKKVKAPKGLSKAMQAEQDRNKKRGNRPF